MINAKEKTQPGRVAPKTEREKMKTVLFLPRRLLPIAAMSAGLLMGLPEQISAQSPGHRNQTASSFQFRPAGSSIITTVVGDHALGGTYSGDGGAALSAGLSGPLGISFGPGGDLLIADTGNGTVRIVSGGRISSMPNDTGYFTTPFGAVQDDDGYFYVAEGDWGGLMKFLTLPNVTTLGQLPVLSVTRDDSGYLYCVDAYGNTVSQWSPDGGVITIAGNGTPGYSGDGGPAVAAQLFVDSYYLQPWGHAIYPTATVDPQGNVYIADTGNNVIRKVTGGVISTVAGSYRLGAGYNGDHISAVNAQLSLPAAVAVDPQGNLYIADSGNNRVRKVDHVTGIITTVAGTGAAGYSGDGGAAPSATLNSPRGLAFDASGNLYVSDTGNHVIRKVTFPPKPRHSNKRWP